MYQAIIAEENKKEIGEFMKEKEHDNKTFSAVEDVELVDVSGGWGSLPKERRTVPCIIECVNCHKMFDSVNVYAGNIKLLTNHQCPFCGSLQFDASKLLP